MIAFRYLALVVVTAFLGCSAHAEKRIALVIANSAYKNVPQLSNPANDASLMADMFKRSGFDSVDVKLDLTVADMRRALREFGGKARDDDAAVIYYVGHGIELDGTNYLVPTDATLETDSDIMDETLPLDRVLFAVEPARQLRLVILDACRDSPFAKTMKRTSASRGIGRGLARVEPASPIRWSPLRPRPARPRRMVTARMDHLRRRWSIIFQNPALICARLLASCAMTS